MDREKKKGGVRKTIQLFRLKISRLLFLICIAMVLFVVLICYRNLQKKKRTEYKGDVNKQDLEE